MPRLHPTVWYHVLPLHPEMIQSSDHDFMVDEICCREMLSCEKDVIDSDDEGHSDDNEDEDEVDDNEEQFLSIRVVNFHQWFNFCI